jgi:hypothetical protein
MWDTAAEGLENSWDARKFAATAAATFPEMPASLRLLTSWPARFPFVAARMIFSQRAARFLDRWTFGDFFHDDHAPATPLDRQ